MTNKNIGGFFELELGQGKGPYHDDAIALTSGRACLNLILATTKLTKLYVPYYICDTALIPLKFHNVTYVYYSVNNDLKPEIQFKLKKNEYVLYVNYFGLMNKHIDELYKQYGDQLIIDNTQAFFEKKYKNCWSFNSARKFFGVPDGGYLYSPVKIDRFYDRNENVSIAHLVDRLTNKKSAYPAFLQNEESTSSEILALSSISEKLLSKIDYEASIISRKNNFLVYEEKFSLQNRLKLSLDDLAIPFCYPLWLEKKIPKSFLHLQNIFIPTLWPDVINRDEKNYGFEKELVSKLLPLPVDHRYHPTDCQRVINAISKQLEECM